MPCSRQLSADFHGPQLYLPMVTQRRARAYSGFASRQGSRRGAPLSPSSAAGARRRPEAAQCHSNNAVRTIIAGRRSERRPSGSLRNWSRPAGCRASTCAPSLRTCSSGTRFIRRRASKSPRRGTGRISWPATRCRRSSEPPICDERTRPRKRTAGARNCIECGERRLRKLTKLRKPPIVIHHRNISSRTLVRLRCSALRCA